VASAPAQRTIRRSRLSLPALGAATNDPRVGPALTAGAVAVAVFALAYAGGGYGTAVWTGVGALLWVALAAALLLRRVDVAVPRAAVAAGAPLLALAVLNLLSAAWGASGETAFAECARTLLYLGIFAAAALGATRAAAAHWLDAIALALVAVATVALASRFFPGLFPDRELLTFLPSAQARLSFPVDYWNGLAALVALAIPLLLRAAVEHAVPAVRSAALAAVPAVGGVLYLTSSRAGAGAAVLSAVAYLALTETRWRTAGALLIGGTAAAVFVAFLSTRDAVVNGPLDSGAAASQGHAAAVALVAASATAGAVWAVAPAWIARVTLPRAAGRFLVGAIAVAAALAVVAAHPAERWREFTAPPVAAAQQRDFVESHLLSSNGNWRWQYWTAAVDQFRTHPVAGGGAGTYEAWWAKNGSAIGFIDNPHSLYFQVLSELGILGLALVLAIVGVGLWSGTTRALGGGDRGVAAAVAAAFAGFALAVGLDWMWQLTVVTAVGMLFLGLATGVATGAADRAVVGRRVALGLSAVAVAAALVQVDAWAANDRLDASRSASARGDRSAAYAAARDARRLQPWAAAPYTQTALLEAEDGRFASARRSIGKALDRDGGNWRLWLIATRIDTRAGNVERAVRELHRAEALNPRSPIFTTPPAP